MLKLSRYVLYDILRSKIILAYTLFLFIVSMSMFQMEEKQQQSHPEPAQYCIDRIAADIHRCSAGNSNADDC